MHFISGKLFYPVVDSQKFFFLFGSTDCCHIFMMFAVIAQVVPVSQNRFDIFRERADPATGHEKGDFYIVFPENGEDILRVLISPGSIEGKRNPGFGGVDTVDRQLPVTYGVAGCMQGRAVIVYVTEDCDQAYGENK